ncbi:MAG: peptidase domain-containing ABC transporter [Burkholderiales bacterium]|nr:peptidase domain-containing ABC transporter [Burkholderiales bacterium]
MSIIDRLSFGLRNKMPLILQTELAECGLACLGMVAGFYGLRTDLATLRHRYAVSQKGATLAQLMQTAEAMSLQSRPLKAPLASLGSLRLPAILHWNFNHFVVLKSIDARGAVIHDPGLGIRRIGMDELSRAFTGVALELWPGRDFMPRTEQQRISLRQLFGSIQGLRRSIAQILMLALALEVFAVAAPLFMQWVIDKVIVSADRGLLLTLAVGFWLVMLLQQLTGTARSWVIMFISTTLNIQWRANVFAHMLRLPASYFEKRHVGDVVSRFSSIDQIQHTLTGSFVEAVLDGLMTVLTLVLMYLYSPALASIAVAATLLYGLMRWAWYLPLRHATEEQIIHAAKQSTHFLESVRGIKTVKLFQRQDQRRASWLALLVDQINADLRTQKLQILFKLANGLLFGTENVLIVALGAKLVLDGHFTVGVLTAFIAYKTMFDGRVGSLIDKLFDFKMLQVQAERVADIVLTDTESAHGLIDAGDELASAPSIKVVDLRFRYSEQEPYVLNGISFEVKAGESLAICGPSGCGKSTLLNLLLGMLPLTEGDILIDGLSIRRLGVEGLRKIVGAVLQDDVLFAGSIGDNIAFFDAQPSRERIEACAALAAVAEDIERMPMRYNSLVGDMGTVLSGGQKQRVLLARAFYKRPRMLLLDEATSHLDVNNEQRVNAAVRGMNITRIMVAHRKETLATADRIITLSGGRILENTSLDQSGEEPPNSHAAPQPTQPLRTLP